MTFLQRNYFYGMALLVPLFIVGLIVIGSIAAIVCVACWLLQLCGVMVLQAQIRTEPRK
jgi:hypothetical protein